MSKTMELTQREIRAFATQSYTKYYDDAIVEKEGENKNILFEAFIKNDYETIKKYETVANKIADYAVTSGSVEKMSTMMSDVVTADLPTLSSMRMDKVNGYLEPLFDPKARETSLLVTKTLKERGYKQKETIKAAADKKKSDLDAKVEAKTKTKAA